MIDEKILKVLKFLREKLKNVNWALVGSVNLALQGVDIEPEDIDILTDKKGAFLINDLLKDYEIKKVEYSESKRFASYFGKFRINGIKIDIMGDFRLEVKKGNWSKTSSIRTRKLVKINETKIPCIPLESELIAYKKIGRFRAAKKIKETLEKHQNKTKIKAVFFDLGNTLVTADDFLKKDGLKLNQELFRSVGYDVSLEELEKADRKAVDYRNSKFRGDARIHEKGFHLSIMCKLLGLNINRKVINKLHEKFREKHHSSFQLLPNTREILSFLKDNDYKLAIISNGSIEGVNRIIDNLKLRRYFDLVVISEEVGKEKSTTIPIKITLEKLVLKPEESVMIGDRIDEDILGAKKLGIISVKYDYGLWKDVNYSGEKIKPDFVINDLLELKEILSGLNERN